MEAFGSTIRRAAILVLAVGLTFASVRYVRPTLCLDFCTQSAGRPCPCGFCNEAQRAGFPFSFLHDVDAASSPISGWGRAGYEDLIPTIFLLDVVFYSVLLALVWHVPSVLRSEEQSRMRDAVTPLVAVVAIGLVGWYVSYQDVLSPSSSNATTRPERKIVGSWTASDDVSGMDFIFFFGDRSQDHSGFSMRVRGVEYNGRYSMVGERTVEISLEHSIALALEQKRGLCANAPSLLEGVCRRSVSSATALAASSPYPDPLPTPVPVVSGVIEDAVFNVDFDGDTMVLTSSSGAAETFSSSCASTWREWVRRSSE